MKNTVWRRVVVQDLVEEVLLGRDVPLCKHMVKHLSQEEQMQLLQQLAEHHKIHLVICLRLDRFSACVMFLNI